jgi:predicted acyl esterase
MSCALGILITHSAGQWCVNFRGGSDATAYITDDLQDAFEHGRTMALSGQPAPAEPVKRRQKRRPTSAAEPMRGSILRGWKAIVKHGYAAVYQDCRGRHGSEGGDRVYADDAADGHDTLDWIDGQSWTMRPLPSSAAFMPLSRGAASAAF